MNFDYRKFLAENKLTKVSRGQETGKAQILSEGICILAEGEKWVGSFKTDSYKDLLQVAMENRGTCSFNLNGKDFTMRPKGDRYLVTSGVNDFGYEAMGIEGACKAAYQYSTGHLKGKSMQEGFDMAEEMDEANKQKEDYLKRQERAQKGNWKGSIGAFVEEHSEELGNMIGKNRQQLKDYVENVMKPELTDEAKQKVDELLDSKKSTFGFIQSLYNFTLKGSGLGLHEEVEDMEAYDDTMNEEILDEEYGIEKTLRMLYNHYAAGNNGATVTITMCGEYCDDMGQAGFAKVEVDGQEVATEQFISDEEWGYSTLNEAIEQKHKGTPQERGTRMGTKGYKGKKAGSDQDKMAKSEMKGEKIDVTIGGVTKSISKQAWSRYRKMTDPEEKKAWKQRHGFIK